MQKYPHLAYHLLEHALVLVDKCLPYVRLWLSAGQHPVDCDDDLKKEQEIVVVGTSGNNWRVLRLRSQNVHVSLKLLCVWDSLLYCYSINWLVTTLSYSSLHKNVF